MNFNTRFFQCFDFIEYVDNSSITRRKRNVETYNMESLQGVYELQIYADFTNTNKPRIYESDSELFVLIRNSYIIKTASKQL